MKRKIAYIAAAVTAVLLLVFGGRQLYMMGYESGMNEGHFGWYDKGYSEGSEDGYERGLADGAASASAALSTADSHEDSDEHGTSDLEHGTSSSEHGENDLEHGKNDLEHGTSGSEHGTSGLEHGTSSSEHANEHECDFVLNKSSKKFHKPDCSSVAKMKEANREYYSGSRDDLIAKGYKPCGSCNP